MVEETDYLQQSLRQSPRRFRGFLLLEQTEIEKSVFHWRIPTLVLIKIITTKHFGASNNTNNSVNKSSSFAACTTTCTTFDIYVHVHSWIARLRYFRWKMFPSQTKIVLEVTCDVHTSRFHWSFTLGDEISLKPGSTRHLVLGSKDHF